MNVRMQVLRQTGVGDGVLRYRRMVSAACAVALFVVLAHVGVAFWAQSEFTQPEGIVAIQARSLAEEGVLYYDLKQYPYTACAYMPLLYGMVAGMYKLGLPLLLSSRLISILALAGIFYLVWKILLLYTGDPLYAWTGLALAGMTQLLLGWGTVGQVDMLAIALSFTAFYLYARFQVLGEATLDWAALFAIAGLFTKQTSVAAPLAIFILLWRADWRKAIRFGFLVGGFGGGMVLGLNALMDGRFLLNTVKANLNPFALYKLRLPLEYILIVISPLIPILLIGLKPSLGMNLKSPFVYLGFASVVFMGTSAKVGADSNYLIETSVLLIVCACCSLKALDFFSLLAGGGKSWVTLLILPLALYGVQNLRVASSGLSNRIERETKFRTQVEKSVPYLAGSGRVLSTDTNVLLRAGRRLEVEPLIYRLLLEAGRVDGTQLLRDIHQNRFETILLYDDLQNISDPDPEIPRLAAVQMDAIRQHYHLVAHLDGPNLNGLYIYQPRSSIVQ